MTPALPRETERHLDATANSHEPYAWTGAKGLGDESEAARGLPDAGSISPSRGSSEVIGVGQGGLTPSAYDFADAKPLRVRNATQNALTGKPE